MISDEKLKALAEVAAENVEKDEQTSGLMRQSLVHELCAELIQRREAERKANSWDDGSDWAVARRLARPSPAWIHYDEKAHKAILDGKIFLDTLEERPK